MKITDLIIDPRSLGSKLWLVEVSPAYEYQNNRRTDTVTGYRDTVARDTPAISAISLIVTAITSLAVLPYFHYY